VKKIQLRANTDGWLRIIKGNKALGVVGSVALASLAFGLGASGLLTHGAGAADDAVVEPGLITVPVERGQLSNDVTVRGDIGFADAADVTLNTTSLTGPAIVTGSIPVTGQELNPLDVALEVTGRPVIVLPGELPAYRTLTLGLSGPDVVQFKEAMRAVGIDAGDPANNVFDKVAADAVRALYERVGYPVPGGAEGSVAAVTAAQRSVKEAQRNLSGAIVQSDRELRDAEQQWAAWPCEDPSIECRVQRAEVETARTRPAEAAARDAIAQAQAALDEARQSSQPQLPVSEVLYLTSLPRRVDSVAVTRGATLNGVSLRVSGAQLQLSGATTESNARLLSVGAESHFDLPDGGSHRAVIGEIKAPTDGGSRWTLEFVPDPLTPEQFTALQGKNVRVSIPVGATAGEVLYVPVSALTAGPGGEARIEVVEGDPHDGVKALTRMVVVDTGLAADGYVEITPVGGGVVNVGDLVVVGK